MSIKRGGIGSDTLSGTDGRDALFGLGGADVLDGLDGRDAVFGGGGNDTAFGGAGDDLVSGGTGDDSIVGDASEGGPNPVELGGMPGRNLLFGGDGNDVIRGGYGEDTAFGGSGNDTIYGWGFGPPSPSGQVGFQHLDDGDVLRGGGGEDSILGGGGNDALDGGSGADYLKGFTGSDTLTGGEGAERFVFDSEGFVGEILDGGIGPGNRDVIADFCRADGDVIDLSGYRSSLLPNTTPLPIFVGQEGFRTDPVVDGYRLQVRYEIEGDRTILQVYAPLQEVPAPFPPGAPNVDIEIELLGVQGVSTDDLFLG